MVDKAKEPSRCGYVAILGRPNVGKSTLMNRLIGQKISITSHKRQTTRHQIVGVVTTDLAQAIYVDTPGIHQNAGNAMGRYLNRAATDVMKGVDVVIWVLEAGVMTEEDLQVQKYLSIIECPLIICINKVDKIKDKAQLLPYIDKVTHNQAHHLCIPISAKKGTQLEVLNQTVMDVLPQGDFIFSADDLTDRSTAFLVSEIVREKLTRHLDQELPYHLSVEVEHFEPNPEKGNIEISAVIYVQRPSQKAIVIGKKGLTLKRIATSARMDIEKLVGQKVFLKLWVKVQAGWSDDERALNRLGYQ